MDTQLFIATAGHVVSALVVIAIGAFVYFQNPKRDVNIFFALFAITAGLFGIFFSWGINLPPSPFAYAVWMLNLVVIFVNPFYLHFALAVTGQAKEERRLLQVSYALGGLLLVASLVFPHLFLPEITPKLFTKSYLNAGPLYAAMVAYFFGLFIIASIYFIRAYLKKTSNRIQIEYLLLASVLGYGLGPLDFFLVFNIPVSILFGMFYGLYVIPIAYGIVAKNLLDIRLVIRRAFFYTLGIALTAGGLTVITLLNNLLVTRVPWLQFWTVPVVTAVVTFVLARIVWLQSQESDRLKYEFITVAAHKLRTPLTRIKWEAATLLEQTKDQQMIAGINNIADSNNRLIQITDILLEASRTQDTGYFYKREALDLAALSHATIERFASLIAEKRLNVAFEPSSESPHPSGDAQRIASVIEVFVENAIMYTPAGGSVTIGVAPAKNCVVLRVKDTGIGVKNEDREHIFSRFFRTDRAKLADTEGIGLGLAMAKNIIERHGGKVGVESEGEGKGSTFWFTLPL